MSIGLMQESSTTSEQSPQSNLAMWMSFLADSRAKTYQWRGTVLDFKAHVLVYGGISTDLLAKLSQEPFYWKTLERLLMTDAAEQKLLRRLPDWGTAHDGELYLLPMPMLPTSENVGFAWPTPTATDTRKRNPPKDPHISKTGQLKLNNQSGTRSQVRLSQTVKYWKGKEDWHTPIANDAKKTGAIELKRDNGLSAQIRWATPTKSDAKGTGSEGSKSQTHDLEKKHLRGQVVEGEETYLNPEWVGMLMGYPPNWTAIS